MTFTSRNCHDVPQGAITKQTHNYSIETLIFFIPEEAEGKKTFRTVDLKSVLTSEKSRKTESDLQSQIWFQTCTDLWAIFSFSSPSKIYKKKGKKMLQIPLQNASRKCTELVVLTYSHKTSLVLVGSRHFNPRCTGKPQHLSLLSEYLTIKGTGIWPTLDCWKQLSPKSPHRLPHSGCSFSALP